MDVRIANREEPDQIASLDLIWVCPVLTRLFWQATSVRNFRRFTVPITWGSSHGSAMPTDVLSVLIYKNFKVISRRKIRS